MKVGILTFHGSHNYGSVLQAYALQRALDGIVGKEEYETINLRKEEQKKYYNVYDSNKTLKAFVSNIYRLRHRNELKEKFNKFENFINTRLSLSAEVNSRDQVEQMLDKYESIICGSDQIWNMDSFDYDDTYLLPFEIDNKISYAASFGGNIDVIKNNKEKIEKHIKKFNYISVRESSSSRELEKIINKKVKTIADPTLLVDIDNWNLLAKDGKLKNEDYIFFYSLGPSREDIELVSNIAKVLNTKILITNTANRHDKMMKATKDLSAGPEDFLSLIKNAKLVCTSSFHCTVFSIMFKKQFWSLNVENEKRLQALLEMTHLKERNINTCNYGQIINRKITDEEFEKAHIAFNLEKEKGLKFLKEALGYYDNMQ